MYIRPDDRVQLARLLRFLTEGEALARDVSRAQATLAPGERLATFLRAQAMFFRAIVGGPEGASRTGMVLVRKRWARARIVMLSPG